MTNRQYLVRRANRIITATIAGLIVALDRWTNGEAPPPVSAYRSLRDATLIPVDAYRTAFPPA